MMLLAGMCWAEGRCSLPGSSCKQRQPAPSCSPSPATGLCLPWPCPQSSWAAHRQEWIRHSVLQQGWTRRIKVFACYTEPPCSSAEGSGQLLSLQSLNHKSYYPCTQPICAFPQMSLILNNALPSVSLALLHVPPFDKGRYFQLSSQVRAELEKPLFRPCKQEATRRLLSNHRSGCMQCDGLYLCRYRIHHQNHPPQCKTGTSAPGRTWHRPCPRPCDSTSRPALPRTPGSSRSRPAPSAYSARCFCTHYCHRARGNRPRISHSKQLQRVQALGGVWATGSPSCLAGVNARSQGADCGVQPGAWCGGKQRYRIQSSSCTHQPTSLWALYSVLPTCCTVVSFLNPAALLLPASLVSVYEIQDEGWISTLLPSRNWKAWADVICYV